MRRKMFLYISLALSVAGIAYSAKQLADPGRVKAIEPECCTQNSDCGAGGKCGKSNCDGLHGGAC